MPYYSLLYRTGLRHGSESFLERDALHAGALLSVGQSLAMVVLAGAADEASPPDFWTHYNIVILT